MTGVQTCALPISFGILPEEAEEVDPAQLIADAQALAAEKDKVARERDRAAREARVELEVFRSAATAGADANALLDSRSFLKSIKGIDPAAEGARDAILTAIEAAVEDNPRLSAAPAIPTRSGGDLSGGNGEPDSGAPEPMDIDSLRARRAARRAKNR